VGTILEPERSLRGGFRDKKTLWGSLQDFLLGFGCDCVVWVLISGLRVLLDSWVIRVLICAEAAIGFGGGPVLNMPWPLRSRMQYDYKQTNHDVKAAKWSHVVACKALELPKFITSLTLVHSYLTGSWVSDMSKP